MLLLRSELNFFRQYGKKEVIYFPIKGLMGVIGPNGAGKSTFFNSIKWAFYGKITDVTNNMIKNQNADKSDRCYVEHDFVYEGNFYRVHRDIVSSRCFLQKNGRTIAIGTGQVTEEVQKIFRMDYKAFGTCYYAEQDDFDALVKLNPGPRVDMLTKLVRIEAIDQAAKKAREDFRDLQKLAESAKKRVKESSELEGKKKALEDEVTSIKNQIDALEKTIRLKSEILIGLSKQKESGKKDYDLHKDLTAELKSIKREIENLNDHVLKDNETALEKLRNSSKRFDVIKENIGLYATLLEEKETLTAVGSKFREKKRVEDEIKQIKLDVQNYVDQYNDFQEKLKEYDSVESKLKDAEEYLKSLQTIVMDLKHEFDKKQLQIESKKEKIKEIEESIQKFDTLGADSPCPTCERPLGEHYEEKIEHFQKEIDELNKQIIEINKEQEEVLKKGKEQKATYDKAAEELKELQNANVQKGKYEAIIEGVKKEVGIRKTNYKKLEEEYQPLKDVEFDEKYFNQLSARINEVKNLYVEAIGIEKEIKRIPEVENKIEEVKNKILTLELSFTEKEKALVELNFDEVAYENIEKDILGTQDEISSIKEEKTDLGANIKIHENQIEFWNQEIKENEKLQEEIIDIENEMKLLTKLDEVYKDYRYDKLNKLAPALSDIMSGLMDRITEGKYDQVELDKDFNIHVYRQGIKNPLSFYSGGERKLAALTQRLAISNLLVAQTGQANFDMLAMDEVFGSMDNARQDNILDMLRNLNEMFSQILIVTHSENVKDGFDNILEIGQDENGFSKAKWETQWDVNETKEIIQQYERQFEFDIEEETADTAS